MGLNIKNERTHALVRQLAQLTGQSQTSAVEDAVRRRIEELSRTDEEVEAKVDRIMQIAAEFSADLTAEDRAALWSGDDYFYDDLGLPT
ncbi:type II toxin-antitoxin system VapB family antitoxin [Georgenia satyanarayanai]|uniref:type II toxin-antitoxin system VapB family antitoxin n=1 Tax=Georgenia satyanarayanai TaxID=860221 RepID=UPI00203C64B2|nr:type II toxin-antitoxin system VapB family antitoxin [Georgenia satyanarayanai]MCM3661419.1 type II toxin-antitoxin system VapB family antitoxin [Georgenia satyanarayanai]